MLLHGILHGTSWPVCHVGPLSHDPSADGAVADHHGNVASKLLAPDRVQVLLEGFEVIRQALCNDTSRDVLHCLHQVGEEVAAIRLAWREAYAAVPHDAGRHAGRGARREVGVPRPLGVEVRVGVDPARQDQEAARVVLALGAPAELRADGGDRATCHRNVADEGRAPGPVHNGASADDEVWLTASERHGCPRVMNPNHCPPLEP
mmetsp:Transcript_20223/g.63442  ORF Transcript_20223/g.63442 Transcript_20223/m.63442 type:complete len:205 (-) Transcript_20223:13-627(-)